MRVRVRNTRTRMYMAGLLNTIQYAGCFYGITRIKPFFRVKQAISKTHFRWELFRVFHKGVVSQQPLRLNALTKDAYLRNTSEMAHSNDRGIVFCNMTSSEINVDATPWSTLRMKLQPTYR